MFEVNRKLIHIVGFCVPFSYFFLSRQVLIPICGVICFCSIVIEVTRFHSPRFNTFLFRIIGQFTRDREQQGITGATYYFIAAFVSIVCFSRLVAIAGMFFLVMGDSAAAVVGTRFGTHAVGEKSLEGSLACLTVCSVIGGILLGWTGLLGAVIATLIELAPLPVDDNLRIPLLSGFIMHIVS
ncbi:MAG: hypothetical protein HXS53_03185 [Theionarchaea archaeon]|nr:hypothetical protein [Theionarchaea archaeon]